jgi:hypothetical protein
VKHPYVLTEPCDACPFLNTPNMKQGFTLRRLKDFADNGEFMCHKTCDNDEESSAFVGNEKSVVCAGMLIFNEKRKTPNQMQRISGRLGIYDPTALNMEANVR